MLSKTKVYGLLFLVLLTGVTRFVWAQNMSKIDRERARVMLRTVTSDVRENYYDAKLRGIDWDKQVEVASGKIGSASTWDVAMLTIAAVFEELKDSHTFFVPPQYPVREEYGWRYQMVGDRCFVSEVRPGSDAEKKHVTPGDEVITIDGFTPTRDSIPKLEYVFHYLQPQSSLNTQLRDRTGNLTELTIAAHVRQKKQITDFGDMTGGDQHAARLEREDWLHLNRPRYKELGDKAFVLKLSILLLQESDVADLIGKARKRPTLILDLRGTPGGAENSLEYLVGSLFDRDVKIADRITRKDSTALIAKSQRNYFNGKLLVLVDSKTSSAGELLARVVQLEKRGIVLGDRTAGAVMEARHYDHQTGSNPTYPFASSVTRANLVMTDGTSLEGRGVIPDQVVLPSSDDLAENRDPVLSRAAELAGVFLDSGSAGKLFPFEWPME